MGADQAVEAVEAVGVPRAGARLPDLPGLLRPPPDRPQRRADLGQWVQGRDLPPGRLLLSLAALPLLPERRLLRWTRPDLRPR